MRSKTSKTNSLTISMNGMVIGHLQKKPGGDLIFSYAKKWLETMDARPISLSLPLSEKPYTGVIVYNFFDNLLPDNDRIRARIQALFQTPTKQPFDLLASIGHDCVGAIQLSTEEQPADVKIIQAERLTNHQIAQVLKQHQQAPLGMQSREQDFRISIAGAQEKTAFLRQNDHWYRPHGTTPTTHIFKLPLGFITHQNIDLRDSCENEWLCSKIATAFGLAAAESEIAHFEDEKVLIVQRFDRKMSQDGSWWMRLPQEDFCQALGYSPALKYQSDGGPGIREIMNLLLAAEEAIGNREIFFQQQILFWLLAAIDGHAKNFSIYIGPAGRFYLTPLYDVMSAYPLLANKQLQKQKIKMAMALRGSNNHYSWHNIQRRNFLSTAKNAQFSTHTAEQLLNSMLARIESVIDSVAGELDAQFPNSIAEPIFKGMLDFRKRLK